MNPLGRHFGMLAAGDMICLEIATGRVAGGNKSRPANAAGYLIHSAIHKRRPGDVHAVCHAHTNAGRAWSVFARPVEMLTQDACNFYGDALVVYAQYGGIGKPKKKNLPLSPLPLSPFPPFPNLGTYLKGALAPKTPGSGAREDFRRGRGR